MSDIISNTPVAMLQDEGEYIHLAYVWCPPIMRRTMAFSEFWDKEVLPELKKRGKNVLVIVNPEEVQDVEWLIRMFEDFGFEFGSQQPTMGVLVLKEEE